MTVRSDPRGLETHRLPAYSSTTQGQLVLKSVM